MRIEELREKIEESKEQIISTLQDLIEIESVLSEAVEGKPFGRDVDKAFEYMLRKGESDGFSIVNVNGYGGHIQFNKTVEKEDEIGYGDTMGILCHLDVVPAGENWDFEPFGRNIEDGKIYGRGTADDKGPTVAAYYAVKILKEMSFEPSKNIRIVLGLDEETNWIGMEKYIEKAGVCDFGITPDGDFPVVNGEKGILNFSLAKKFKKDKKDGLILRKIVGGNAHNMVADWARAIVLSKNKEEYAFIKEIAKGLSEEGFGISTKGIGKSLEISVKGISAHGSTPQKGKNAITKVIEILSKLNFVQDDVMDFLEFYKNHIGYEFNGQSLGIDIEDEVSGKTFVNVGIIELDEQAVKLKMNVRYPVTRSDEEIYSLMAPVLEKYSVGIIKEAHKEPIFIDKDEKFIKLLIDVYQEISGDTVSEPKIMGGGTYARSMKNFVAYGGIFPGEEELAHQKNEFISIESLLNMTHIYAKAIYELCK